MRYFTKKLWTAAQNDDDGENIRSWRSSSEAYIAQLENLRPRLPTNVFEFFAQTDIHDGELISLNIIDGSRPAPLDEAPRPWFQKYRHPVEVGLTILDAYDKLIWTLTYRSIRRVVVDFPSKDPLFYKDGDGFSDLGYHELTDAQNGFFRHEILFSTGAILLFEFQTIEVKSHERKIPILDL